MSSAKQNRSIARLIVGAMSIDGSLSKNEREKVAATLDTIGMGELVADVGVAIDEADGSFNMFQECRQLMESLGNHAGELAPMIFRIVCDVIAADRFVSAQEATYLSAMGRRLDLSSEHAKAIFKEVLAARRSRLEVAASGIDAAIHPGLKELLNFPGAEDLVGASKEGSIDQLIIDAENEGLAADVSIDEVTNALAVLGLGSNAKLNDAQAVWKETIDNLNLPKMANMGETFVSAAIGRITKINEAYKIILQFHQKLDESSKAAARGI